MSSLQARHRGHNIPDGVTTFNEIEYDREGGVFLNRTKLILLAIIVFLLTAFSAFVGRYTAERNIRQKADSGVAESQIPFLAVEPESYKVFLDPKLYAADGTVSKHDVDYDGRVEVIFRPKTDTSVISLHVGILKINGDPLLKRRLSMDTPTDQVLKDDSKYVLNTEVNNTQETMTVTVGDVLKAGHYYSLFVNFTGTIGHNPESGFFKVVFDKKEEVKNQWYVATKLAPRKARNLLPCVDNPKHKAIFEMSVVRSKDTNVIFNTKVRTTEPYNNDLLLDHFEKTGLIRPDSLGLFMSNFKSNTVSTDGSVELTVWSPDSTDSIEIITDVVPKTLDFMKSYLATNFPATKLDIVVVPSGVETSTESPGLIVIKDSILSTMELSSMVEYQKSVEKIVTRVVRQWLMPLRGLDRGNDEDKWLNEAIVNFLKIINIDHIKPEWKFGARFSLDTIQQVMFYDSWTNSETLATNDLADICQFVSSGKGTSILRMLNNTFTEDIFKQTLREYVHTEIYKYKDTVSFWTLLDDNARNKSIKLPESSAVLQIVNTWMQNKNYPLVKLQVDGDDLVVKQFRFDYDEPKLTNDWVIPITLTSGAAYTTTVWLENIPETRVSGYITASNGSWILANQHQTGYYRVVYEDVLLDKISYEISQGKSFDSFTMAQLIGDIFEGAFAGVIGFSDALGFLDRVIQKTGPNSGCWEAIFNAFNKIETILHGTKHYDSLSIFMEMVVEKAYKLFEDNVIDSPDKILGKMSTLSFAGRVEMKKFVWWSKKQFDKWKKTTTEINPIAPNYRQSVYCTIMQFATKHDYRFMLRKYASSKRMPDRKSIAKSFSCSRNSHFLQTILSTEENVKFNDLFDIWQSILDDPTAGSFAFNYLRNNWETIYQEYSDSNLKLLCTMLHAAVRGLNSLADLEVLQAFNDKYFGNTVENRNPTLIEVLRFEEEILRQKITWREKYETVISGWITPKSAKSKSNIFKNDQEQNKFDDSETDKIVETDSIKNDVKIEEVNSKSVSPVVTEQDKPVAVSELIKEPAKSENEKVLPIMVKDNIKPDVISAEVKNPIIANEENKNPTTEQDESLTKESVLKDTVNEKDQTTQSSVSQVQENKTSVPIIVGNTSEMSEDGKTQNNEQGQLNIKPE